MNTLNYIKRLAEQGNTEAQYKLAMMYANGDTVDKNEFIAIEWYQKVVTQGLAYHKKAKKQLEYLEVKKAAKQGNARAQYNLGLMYKNGQGVVKNEITAVEWFTKAAEQSDAEAKEYLNNKEFQYSVGLRYAQSNDITNNETMAVEWFTKAAEQGNTEAQYKLAVMYANGDGVDKNEFIAIEWYQKVVTQGLAYHKNAKKQLEYLEVKKAAEQSDAEAQYKLGRIYANGDSVVKNERTAVEWFTKAAEQGYAKAKEYLNNKEFQYSVGLRYDQSGDINNQIIAAEWYQRSAEQGHVIAQLNLGMAYVNGKGVVKNERTAVQWFQKAAEQGYAKAEEYLKYLEIKKAAEQNDAEAQYKLGRIYANGNCVVKNERTAVEWYTKAAEQGYVKAEEYLKYLEIKKAAEQNDIEAQYTLGRMYANGDSVVKNERIAVEWFTKAAEQGNAKAQYNLGLMYENGQGVVKNESTAVRWYQRAAEQGHAQAQYELGKIYENGQIVVKNHRIAVKWYTKAAEQDYAAAKEHLKRLKYLEVVKAAEQGNAYAQYKLGVMYEHGQGVSKHLQTAYFWFLLADIYGNQSAEEQIIRIEKQLKPGPINIAQDDAASWRPKQ